MIEVTGREACNDHNREDSRFSVHEGTMAMAARLFLYLCVVMLGIVMLVGQQPVGIAIGP